MIKQLAPVTLLNGNATRRVTAHQQAIVDQPSNSNQPVNQLDTCDLTHLIGSESLGDGGLSHRLRHVLFLLCNERVSPLGLSAKGGDTLFQLVTAGLEMDIHVFTFFQLAVFRYLCEILTFFCSHLICMYIKIVKLQKSQN